MTGALDDLESGAGGLHTVGCGAVAQALTDLPAAADQAAPALGDSLGQLERHDHNT